MMTLKIYDAANVLLFEKTGMNISEVYTGQLSAGYRISVRSLL